MVRSTSGRAGPHASAILALREVDVEARVALECVRPVDQVAVDILELESRERMLQRRHDVVLVVPGVPQLGSHKQRRAREDLALAITDQLGLRERTVMASL